jgi:hypothetical protein
MLVIRGSAASVAGGSAPAVAEGGTEVPADAGPAARAALEASIADGQPLSQRELARRFEIPRSRAAGIARDVAAASNGHASLNGHAEGVN